MKQTNDNKNICKRCGKDFEIYGNTDTMICDDCDCLSNDDKLKEEIRGKLITVFGVNSVTLNQLNRFIEHILFKAREGYVKKEEFVEQKCREIDNCKFLVCGKECDDGFITKKEAKKIIRG